MTDAMKERIQIKEAIRSLRAKGMKMGDVTKVVHESLHDVCEEEGIL